MTDERDELIERAAESLRNRPSHRLREQRSVARILATVHGRPRRWWRALSWDSTSFSLAATGAVAAAALLIGFLGGDAADRGETRNQLAALPAAQPLPVVPVARATDGTQPVPVQFALRGVQAGKVTLVGDFNEWAPDAVPLERGADGTWSTTLRLSPGRHVYAFLVDGTTWMTDPRAPRARDLDFGRENSVLIVQAP